ncbi:MAG: transposase, partial [Phycisphaerae bacterium]|nr:transposase [Phycisphaerae bacterium]
EFIIMPDHMHGIITIKPYRFDKHSHDTTLSMPASKIAEYGQMVPRSISILLRTYKSIVARWINSQRHTPGERIWQRNYYEHIVRNAEDLNCIRKYIKTNPNYWKR